MKIDTTIVDAYLDSEDISRFSSMWLYTGRRKDGVGSIFHGPPAAEVKREVVSRIKEEIITHASAFVPCNAPIWEALTENWREFLEEAIMDLVVGLPEPNDASIREAPDGKHHIIFDLLCWEKYLGLMPLSDISQNLLTHELFHVMVEKKLPDIKCLEMQGGYIDQLDAITFNEGFAHLVSYNGQEINTVSWDGEKLTDVYNASVSKMKDALRENSPEKQKQYVYEANFGNYYDKYAAMCGLIYLGRQWQSGGILRLKELFDQGYCGFAARSAGLSPYREAHDNRS